MESKFVGEISDHEKLIILRERYRYIHNDFRREQKLRMKLFDFFNEKYPDDMKSFQTNNTQINPYDKQADASRKG